MDWKLELVLLPVSDVDRAKAFYTEKVGFNLDVDHQPSDEFRVVQMTPPGSACSITIGKGITDATPGSVRGTHLVVSDIEAARTELVERGVEVYELATTEQYVAVLDGHAPKFAPGERFSYCNSGYVVLALIAERVSGAPFHKLVVARVCEPAGMRDTEFLRSDELPGRTALGYVGSRGGSRTNVFHLPVRGSGDGGIYSTAADFRLLWSAFFAGRIVPLTCVEQMVRPGARPRRSVTASASGYTRRRTP